MRVTGSIWFEFMERQGSDSHPQESEGPLGFTSLSAFEASVMDDPVTVLQLASCSYSEGGGGNGGDGMTNLGGFALSLPARDSSPSASALDSVRSVERTGELCRDGI